MLYAVMGFCYLFLLSLLKLLVSCCCCSADQSLNSCTNLSCNISHKRVKSPTLFKINMTYSGLRESIWVAVDVGGWTEVCPGFNTFWDICHCVTGWLLDPLRKALRCFKMSGRTHPRTKGPEGPNPQQYCGENHKSRNFVFMYGLSCHILSKNGRTACWE